jgi:hypothetical protein
LQCTAKILVAVLSERVRADAVKAASGNIEENLSRDLNQQSAELKTCPADFVILKSDIIRSLDENGKHMEAGATSSSLYSPSLRNCEHPRGSCSSVVGPIT